MKYYVYTTSVKESLFGGATPLDSTTSSLSEFDEKDTMLKFLEHDPCRGLDSYGGTWITTHKVIEGNELSIEHVVEVVKERKVVEIEHKTTTYKVNEKESVK